MGKHKGRRVMITMPHDVFERIQRQADTETRNISQMILVMILEGLEKREAKE